MKVISKPILLEAGTYLVTVDYETSSPGYGKDVKETILTLERLFEIYLKDRRDKCYCGHTDRCDCADLDLGMFKDHLKTGNISFDKKNGWGPINQQQK